MYLQNLLTGLVITFCYTLSHGQAPVTQSVAKTAIHSYYNLEPLWDEQKVCRNPHKGWYIHYFDNGITKYGDKLDPKDDLHDFPGLNDVYLRLAWSYLEPEEGKFNWPLIDSEIDRWTKRGYKISFRISCKEYGDVQYATPAWVEKAGAKGTMIRLGKNTSWEPDYGDPVFLAKLENFHRAFAQRYDGKPYVEYVDIGSYGDWGEGHTAFSARREWPASVIKKHIDIHRKHYKKSVLMISDDIVGSRESTDGSREEIMDYLVKQNITLRDDGVSVKWFADRFGSSTLRNPEFFERFWKRLPINLELEHYDNTIREKTWNEGKPFEQAVEEAHATFIGFHGYPRSWLAENKELAERLANKCGYWYFIRSAEIPAAYARGKSGYFKFVAINKGVAPAYHNYLFEVRLSGPNGNSYTQIIQKVDNRKWVPGQFAEETHRIQIPNSMTPGTYSVEIAMFEETSDGRRYLELPFQEEIKKDHYYRIASVEVQ